MKDDYFQPDFYHFDEDSLTLVNFTFKNLPENIERFLEVGAGCGVISLELSRRLFARGEKSLAMDLFEIQESFKPYLKKNIEVFGIPSHSYHPHFKDFVSLEFLTGYPCILSNPPFFLQESSRSSQDERRDLCRRISNQGLRDWLFKMVSLLEKEGNLFFCHREPSFDASLFGAVELKRELKNKSTFYWWKRAT